MNEGSPDGVKKANRFFRFCEFREETILHKRREDEKHDDYLVECTCVHNLELVRHCCIVSH